MPSPIPVTRLLRKDIYPSADIAACSSPLFQLSQGSTLQVPPQRLHGKVANRLWSSVIYWDQLRSVEVVGSGGFGSVYKAEYLGETVALKKVKKSAKNKLASRQSFWAELNAAHLHHKNVVRIIAASTCVLADLEEEAIGAIVMEFVGSRNLQQIIYESSEDLGEDRWLKYSTDIVKGLSFLHSHSVVHLDIKPANVLVSRGEVCKIADFGCSLKLDRDCEVSAVSPQVSHGCGTYSHRAPELLKGEQVSPKADIYSLGITMWQLLTREPPYTGDRQHVLYAVVAHNLRPSVCDHQVFLSVLGKRCAELLGRCWSADVRCRPSAEDVLHQLELLRSPSYEMLKRLPDSDGDAAWLLVSSWTSQFLSNQTVTLYLTQM
ncbi:PREDICTED: serine/threonine-protein kinase mos-like [Poecilia mexicana]|uniref:serine/threonine-protein kinase mos-like n=1 Tax=Poecilia mexicana TaxID=48701 RepID=UPI00072DBC6C|nr:PREDICTED: serine/threonine-protein kinase mos-like [Poecilia mexicana]XP_014835191.1 PREDICTED: serine/threonine-protein kinase mos-like [Poecilia mexicana]